jgi:hypothetical protein
MEKKKSLQTAIRYKNSRFFLILTSKFFLFILALEAYPSAENPNWAASSPSLSRDVLPPIDDNPFWHIKQQVRPQGWSSPTCFIMYAEEPSSYTPNNHPYHNIKTIVQLLILAGVTPMYARNGDRNGLRVGGDIHEYMRKGILSSRYVLVLYTRTFCEKSRDPDSGISFELALLQNRLKKNEDDNRFFLPFVISGTPETSIPTCMQRRLAANATGDTGEFDRNSFIDEFSTLLNDRIYPSSRDRNLPTEALPILQEFPQYYDVSVSHTPGRQTPAYHQIPPSNAFFPHLPLCRADLTRPPSSKKCLGGVSTPSREFLPASGESSPQYQDMSVSHTPGRQTPLAHQHAPPSNALSLHIPLFRSNFTYSPSSKRCLCGVSTLSSEFLPTSSVSSPQYYDVSASHTLSTLNLCPPLPIPPVCPPLPPFQPIYPIFGPPPLIPPLPLCSTPKNNNDEPKRFPPLPPLPLCSTPKNNNDEPKRFPPLPPENF